MSSMVSSNSLLVEFLTEELPPINLEKNIGAAFAAAVSAQLAGFLDNHSQEQFFVAPRRFGLVIKGINLEQAPRQISRKGPALASGLKDGKPTPALFGFAKSCACQWQDLEQRSDGYFHYSAQENGNSLATEISAAINNALKKIPIAKAMRWGDSEYSFVRPVHNLVVMLNSQVLPCQALGLAANAITRGHRFMSNAPLKIKHAASYLEQMQVEGKVIAEFSARREIIQRQLAAKAAELDLVINPAAGLLDEVTALVEWPEVLCADFDCKFLAVPQECLILSMAKNQKYFALLDKTGKLTNKFLFVTNLISKAPQLIIAGNQKVLSARLADAEFFYEFDKRTPLAQFSAKMAAVVYHNQLGSQLERIGRLQEIAAAIAPLLAVDPQLARATAYLLKADLATEMVAEFPELQGVMGRYYALSAGESQQVASAIEQHYYPRFSGDELPTGNLAKLMSLSDKLESLIGIWGIGLIPSGDKDPYALRRAALGIVRMLLECDLDLHQLLTISYQAFAAKQLAANTCSEVYQFILQRLANYLSTSANYPLKVVNALLATADFAYPAPVAKKFNYLRGLLDTLVGFADTAANQSLFQANKRIENILKKNEAELRLAPIQSELLFEAAEIELYSLFVRELEQGQRLIRLRQEHNWPAYFAALAGFNQALDNFFTSVMVMTDELAVRHNRLNLLKSLHLSFNRLCQLSELA